MLTLRHSASSTYNEDLSALATFQSIVYGNDMLVFREQRSYESVTTPSDTGHDHSALTPPPHVVDAALNDKTVPVDAALNDIQQALDSMNKCHHQRVRRKWQKSNSGTVHFIECEYCGKELYHFSENTQVQNKDNVRVRIKKEIIRKDHAWYEDIYSQCNHPESFRDNTLCKQCGQSVYFVLD
eukprot:472920_1